MSAVRVCHVTDTACIKECELAEKCVLFAGTSTHVERIDHPHHYTSHPSGIECIDVVEHMGFNLGNAIKYIWRADEKGNTDQDLAKAEWYIKRERELRRKLAGEPGCHCGAGGGMAGPDMDHMNDCWLSRPTWRSCCHTVDGSDHLRECPTESSRRNA